MQIVTLVARPGTLPPSTAAAVAAKLGAGAVTWLAPEEAVEFPLTAPDPQIEPLRSELRAQGVDLALQRADGRRKMLLVADMDSTMIGQECIDELADLAGVGAQVKQVTARAMNGELDFAAALRERVALLAGQDASIIDRVLSERITLAPGGHTLVATMRAHGARAALVSGGFTAFTAPVAAQLGFDEHHGNRLEVADGRLSGTVAEPILGRDAKVSVLRRLSRALPRGLNDAMAVGDGANDLGMLQLAGAGVALHAKPAVAACCSLRIDHGDLTALLFLQGYSRDEFVS